MCNKSGYASRSDAKRASDKHTGRGREKIYQCKSCGLFHITSMTSRQYRQARKHIREVSKQGKITGEIARIRREEYLEQQYVQRFEQYVN